MKKMVFVMCFWLVLAGMLYFGFNHYTSSSYGLSNDEKMVDVDVKSEEVTNMISVLSTSDYLRNGNMQADTLDDETIFKQILLSLTPEDYSELNIRPTKIMCQIKNNLWFISSDTCKVRVIDKDVIKKYERKLFDLDRDLDLEEISFQGFHCKLNKKYYCHMTYYSNSSRDYSFVDKAYKKKDEMVVYEYYLHIDYDNDEICRKYYGDEFCDDKKKEMPDIDKNLIKKDGVYYKHIFKKNRLGEYYLYSSDVELL